MSSVSKVYEEENDEDGEDGDDGRLESAMGKAEAIIEILAVEIIGNVLETEKDKGLTKNVDTVSIWQNFRRQDSEFSCCNPVSLMEDEHKILRRERKKV